MPDSEKYHIKLKIVISGAAETEHCGAESLKLAEEVGREVVRQGCILVTGATTGIPYWAAKGAKEEGGFVIGVSPAISEVEHVRKYHLPVDYHDVLIHTGQGYSGRNLLLTRVGDGIISICGRIGTINEFTIAFEEHRPIGVMEGPWEIDDLIKEMVAKAHRGPGKIVYSKDPKELVAKVIAMIKEEKGRTNHYIEENHDKKPLDGGE